MEIPPFEVCPGCHQPFILPVYRCEKCGYAAQAGDVVRNAPIQTANPSLLDALFAPPVDGTKPITGFASDKPDTPTSGIVGKLLVASGIGAVVALRSSAGSSPHSFPPLAAVAFGGAAGLIAGSVLVLFDIANAGIERAKNAGLPGKRWKALRGFTFFLIFLAVIPICLIICFLTMP